MHKTVRELESEKIQVTTDLCGQALSINIDIQTSKVYSILQIFCWKNELVSWIEVKHLADAGIK